MNFKGFDKTYVSARAKRYGFKQVDDDAFVRIVLVMEVLLHNILNNVKHVSSHLDVKVISKKHLQMVLDIMNSYKQVRAQKGGGLVLPGEYFGHESGRYFPDGASALSGEQYTSATNELSRQAIVFHSGGSAAAKIQAKTNIKALIDNYKASTHATFRVSTVAYDIIADSIDKNMQLLLSACKRAAGQKGEKLTLRLVSTAIQTQFPYMSLKLQST